MKPGDTITLAGRMAVNPEDPIPLEVTEGTLEQMFGAVYGDVVTISASDGSPARDIRTGFTYPVDQRWVLTRPKGKDDANQS